MTLRACGEPKCPTLVTSGKCAVHQPKERDRPNADIRKLYHTPRWKGLRRLILLAHPLCQICEAEGRVCASTDVDHITPHRGDLVLFWLLTNLQALCHSCHSVKTGRGQ